MSNDDPPQATAPSSTTTVARNANTRRSFFSIPPPLKRVFDKFPLVTYPENELPPRARALKDASDENVLFVFATEDGARQGQPSHNPVCLKWQTYLKISGLQFRTVASSNHASPSGALPFLLPAGTGGDAIPSNKLKRWLASQKSVDKVQEPSDMRYEAYASLLEGKIRKAWLYHLYLNLLNAPLVHRLYVESCSSQPFVQLTIVFQLRRAAEAELTKASSSNTIIEADIMHGAEEAFDALSTSLGDDEWFFGQEKPGLFDASVFAYTHLILDEQLGWQDSALSESLKKYANLVRHREQIMGMYY